MREAEKAVTTIYEFWRLENGDTEFVDLTSAGRAPFAKCDSLWWCNVLQMPHVLL